PVVTRLLPDLERAIAAVRLGARAARAGLAAVRRASIPVTSSAADDDAAATRAAAALLAGGAARNHPVVIAARGHRGLAPAVRQQSQRTKTRNRKPSPPHRCSARNVTHAGVRSRELIATRGRQPWDAVSVERR